MPWTDEDKEWIVTINNLLNMMLGPDHFEFEQTPDKTLYCCPPVSAQVRVRSPEMGRRVCPTVTKAL